MMTYESNPFRGPNPLTEGDPIFGRDRDLRLIRDQLLSDRLLLLHSTSGCGKTSLVEAGLRPMLAKKFYLEKTVSLKRTEGGNAKEWSLQARLPIDVKFNVPGIPSQEGADGAARKEELKFFFFDQFEEVLADKKTVEEDRIAFFKSLGLLLERRTIWALFAIREDYLGDLQPYLRYLPNQLTSRYRLTQLSVRDATTAIQMRQISRGNERKETVKIAFTESAAKDLADNLARSLDSRAAGKIVEPVHLQVVCSYLWGRMDHPITSLPPDKELGENLLSVTAALADYYTTILSSLAASDEDLEFRLRAWFDSKLIDKKQEQRLRVRYSPDATGITTEQLDYLKNKYLIRDDQPSGPTPDRVVELAHDRLIVPIIQDNELWFSKFAQPWREAAAEYHLAPSPRLLLHGAALKEASEWARRNPAKLEPGQRTFLDASVRQRRLGYVTAVAGGAAMVATVTILVAFLAIAQSRRKVEQANLTISQAANDIAQANRDRATAKIESASAQLEIINSKNAADKARTDTAKAQAEIERAGTDIDQANQVIAQAHLAIAQANSDTALAKRQIADTKATANAEIAREKEVAAQGISNAKHIGNSLEAIGDAKEQESVGLALTALNEARLAGQIAFERNDKSNGGHSENIVERAIGVTTVLMSRILLEKTICLRGYVQSFAVVDPQSTLVAVDQSGQYYAKAKTSNCPTEESPDKKAIVTYPTASAVAKGSDAAAFGDHDGTIRVFDGKAESAMGLGQQVSALTLSNDGHFVGAASVLWSVGVWRVDGTKQSRVLQWPGSIRNPQAWLRWLNIFRTTSDQMTNALAIHIDEQQKGREMKGFLAEGREDGCARIAPVYMERFRSTKPLVSLGCNQSKPLVSMALSESGELLATGTRQGQITLWDLSGSSESWKSKDFTNSYVLIADSQSENPNRQGCGSSVTSLTFLKRDGWDMLVAGCQDGSIHMFDISRLKFGTLNAFTDGEVKPVLKGAIGSVTMLSFDSKNNRLYSTGDSRRIELWRVPSKTERITLDVLRAKLDVLAKEAAVASDSRPMGDRISNLIQDICKTSDSLSSFEVCKTKR